MEGGQWREGGTEKGTELGGRGDTAPLVTLRLPAAAGDILGVLRLLGGGHVARLVAPFILALVGAM